MGRFNFKVQYIVLALILALGFLLRVHNINTWPRDGATHDEYAWTWLGINLIQNHEPISWSPHPQYTNRTPLVYRDAPYFLVKPYLEHPPLFGLVAGSFALLSGADNMYDVSPHNIRGLALFLGLVSILMIYVLASEIYGHRVGLLSAFIYSIIPSIVVGSRIVENENFFIPIFLLVLYLTSRFIKTNNPWARNIAAVLCGLLMLAKVPWVAAPLAVVLILFYTKKYRDAGKFIAIVIPIFLLFIVYGIYWDSELFFSLWQLQLQRYDLTYNSLFAVFTSPYLVDRFMIDGWIYFGWFAVFLLAVKDIKKNYMILLPFLAYLAVFVFAIPNEPGHGWYRYPFYPFFAISIALFLKEYFTKNYFLTFLCLLITGLSMLQLSWAQSVGFSFVIFRGFLVFSGLTLAPLFIPKTKRVAYFASYALFVFVILLTIWSVRNYNEQ